MKAVRSPETPSRSAMVFETQILPVAASYRPVWADELSPRLHKLHPFNLILFPGCVFSDLFIARAYVTALLARHLRNALVVVSGADRGMSLANVENITEGEAGGRLVFNYGVNAARLLLDLYAVETFGNLLFIDSLIRLKKIYSLLIVTEASHGERMIRIAEHLWPGLRVNNFSVPSPAKVDLARAFNDNSSVAIEFAARFLEEVPKGDSEAAFRWIKENHFNRPYQGINSLTEVHLEGFSAFI
jgi:uncharacterized SAM-binding protein YcdF (DUF218 family)